MKKVLILLALPSVALKQSLGISLEVQEDLSAKTVADAQRLAPHVLHNVPLVTRRWLDTKARPW